MDNPTIRRMYDKFSSIPLFWELDAWTCRATESSPYRTSVIEKLALSEGAEVLDVACGTGLNFNLLSKALSGTGMICGIDQSSKTLRLARKRIEKFKFENVELIETDAPAFVPKKPFDAAICTFAIEIIPPWKETVDMMVRAVRPGGRVGFIGFKESSLKRYKVFNRFFRTVAVPFGGVDLDRNVREHLAKSCDERFYEEVYGGFYYLLVGEKRS